MVDTETDEEDVYFTPTSSSNLASLFNTTMLPLQQGNDASLTYKPPKQPNIGAEQNIKPTKVTYESSIIIFKEVHAFQMINKEYLPLGKCGFTLVGNEKVKIYQLLLYKNKDNIISSTKPTPSLEISLKPNNYISFTDDKKLIWALHLNTEDDLNDFLKMIVTKCQCKLIKKIEDPINKVGKPDLEEDVQNVKKEDIFHSCSEIMDGEKNSTPQDTSTEESTTINKSEKTNVKNKVFGIHKMSNSIDSDGSDSSQAIKKADIMNRVAKMGKKLFVNDPIDITDSSDIDENITTSEQKIRKFKPSKHNLTEKPHTSQSVEKQDYGHGFQNKPNITNSQILIPYQDNKVIIPSLPVTTDQLNMFFLESKNSTTEIKFNMLKLQTGVEEVLKIIKKSENDIRSISTQTDNEDMITENKKLLLLVSQQNDTLEKLKENNEKLRTRNEELLAKAAENSYEIINLIDKNSKTCIELQAVKHKLNEVEDALGILKNKPANIHPSDDQVLLEKSGVSECETKIKHQMNTFFKEACEHFIDEQQYDGKTIKKQLAQTIIQNTYSILKAIKELFNSN